MKLGENQMKKTFILLSVLLFSITSYVKAAEVTISGQIFEEICFSCEVKDDTAGTVTDQDGTNAGGFSGVNIGAEEDLGNGMTAFYSQYWGIEPSGGTSVDGWVNYDGRIGLKGDFGSVFLNSREQIYELLHITDAFGAQNSNQGGNEGSLIITRMGDMFNFTRIDEDALTYQMAPMGALTFEMTYGWAGAQATSTTALGAPDTTTLYDSSYMILGATYDMGDLVISGGYAGYTEVDPFSGTSVASGAADATGMVGVVKYTMGPTLLAFVMNDQEIDVDNNLTGLTNTNYNDAKTFERGGYTVNIQHSIATGMLTFNYASQDDMKIDGTSLADSGASGYHIGYIHNLAESTKLFLFHSELKDDANFNTASTSQLTETNTKAGMIFSF
jgi:predicted porin